MNRYAKILLGIFLSFTAQHVSAQEISYTWESGTIENVRFEKEEGRGHVYVDDILLFDGIYDQNIEGVVTKKIGSYNYLEICPEGCHTYIIDPDKKLHEINLELKSFASFIRDFDSYIVFVTSFNEEQEHTVLLFDKKSNRYIGTRYFQGIDINNTLLIDDMLTFEPDTRNVPISSFNEFSYDKDRGLITEWEFRIKSLTRKLSDNRVILIPILILFILGILYQKRNRKNNFGI